MVLRVLYIQIQFKQDVYYIQPTIPLEYYHAWHILFDNYGYLFSLKREKVHIPFRTIDIRGCNNSTLCVDIDNDCCQIEQR